MMGGRGWLALVIMAWAVTGCVAAEESETAIDVDLQLPQHFPEPSAPVDNPLTVAAIELGRHLFYDVRLSSSGSLACASCHKQEFAFADNRAVSLGATGAQGVLNAPSLGNVIYARPLTWGHGNVTSIEEQLVGPMFGESPIEMGMTGNESVILGRLAQDPTYVRLVAEAFPGRTVDLDLVRFALASFARSLVSHQAPFDAFLAGDVSAMTPSAIRGSELFYSERLGCSHCHAGFAFTTAVRSGATTGSASSPFHNIGLYNIDGQGGYPNAAPGLIEESGLARDMGRFRVPSLRNVALTAPYGHDGSVATLAEFIKIYEDGGRNLDSGQNAGDGRDNPLRSTALKSFELTDAERDDLIAFLESLSDTYFVTNPAYASPW